MPKSKKKARSKKASSPAVQKRRVVRDVLKGPTLRQIEEALAAGSRQSLGNFRTMIGW